jgi:hypothetical protein
MRRSGYPLTILRKQAIDAGFFIGMPTWSHPNSRNEIISVTT